MTLSLIKDKYVVLRGLCTESTKMLEPADYHQKFHASQAFNTFEEALEEAEKTIEIHQPDDWDEEDLEARTHPEGLWVLPRNCLTHCLIVKIEHVCFNINKDLEEVFK